LKELTSGHQEKTVTILQHLNNFDQKKKLTKEEEKNPNLEKRNPRVYGYQR
jgi:hypothetical protein